MQKYKKAAVNIAILTMILTTGLTSKALASLNSDLDFDLDLRPTYSDERQEKIINTFEKNDFNAWKKMVGQKNKVGEIIDENS